MANDVKSAGDCAFLDASNNNLDAKPVQSVVSAGDCQPESNGTDQLRSVLTPNGNSCRQSQLGNAMGNVTGPADSPSLLPNGASVSSSAMSAPAIAYELQTDPVVPGCNLDSDLAGPEPHFDAFDPEVSADDPYLCAGPYTDESESDQESHTSSLESAPEHNENGLLRDKGGRSGSEEDLGSSTSCSVDSFEITSPSGTLSMGKKNNECDDKEDEFCIESLKLDPSQFLSTKLENCLLEEDETPQVEETSATAESHSLVIDNQNETSLPNDLCTSLAAVDQDTDNVSSENDHDSKVSQIKAENSSFDFAQIFPPEKLQVADARNSTSSRMLGNMGAEAKSAKELDLCLQGAIDSSTLPEISADKIPKTTTDSFKLSSSCDAVTSPVRHSRTHANPEALVACSSPLDASSPSAENSRDGSLPSATTSASNSLMNSRLAARQSIHEELSALDTALPHLDFDKLEEQLVNAQLEREQKQRKLMSEEVRRRLAMDSLEDSSYPPAATKRPSRSNLAMRLQAGRNLQICYMNDTGPETEDDESDNDDDDDDGEQEAGTSSDDDFDSVMSKSRSAPDLNGKHKKGRKDGNLSRSTSTASDSKRASELRRANAEKDAIELSDADKRREKLAEETRVMLAKAKEAAHMMMEVEKQQRSSKSPLEDIVGVPFCKRRLTRVQLTKMGVTQLQIILNELLNKVDKANSELVQFLIERDNLHMEQDSMLVDVEDHIQHQASSDVKVPAFLIIEPHPSNAPSRFRIFKK